MSCVIYHNGTMAADRRIQLDWRSGPHGHILAKKLYVAKKKDFAVGFLGYHFPEKRWLGVEVALRHLLIENQGNAAFTLDDEVFNTLSRGISIFILTKEQLFCTNSGEEMGSGILVSETDDGIPVGGGTGFSAARIVHLETHKPLGECIEFVARFDSSVSKEHDVITQAQLKPLGKKKS